MLSPTLGRFLSRDPLPEQGQPDILYDNNEFGDWLTWMRNTYGYSSNNPLNYTDPSGLQPREIQVGGGWSSIGSSFYSMGQTYYALGQYAVGNSAGANQTLAAAYANGPLGQTQNSSGGYYYGTRGALGVATVAATAAVAVGTTEFVCLSNQPLLAEGRLLGGQMTKGGLFQIRPTGRPPWLRFDYHPFRPGGPSIPHIDAPPFGWHHWPWQ
jgi:RHS repeat-associated protein